MYDLFMNKVLPVISIIALLWLQAIFSNNDNKKLGLILPSVCFGFSVVWIILVLVMALPNMTQETIQVVDFIKIFFVINIPTVVLGLIYVIVRKVRK